MKFRGQKLRLIIQQKYGATDTITNIVSGCLTYPTKIKFPDLSLRIERKGGRAYHQLIQRK